MRWFDVDGVFERCDVPPWLDELIWMGRFMLGKGGNLGKGGIPKPKYGVDVVGGVNGLNGGKFSCANEETNP